MFSKILKNTLERIVLFNVTATFVLSAGSVYGESYQQIVINEYGPPNVMQLVEQEMLPEPAAGEVRIKVLAAGASFTDTMVRKGVYVVSSILIAIKDLGRTVTRWLACWVVMPLATSSSLYIPAIHPMELPF
jgi:hypothetical protein